MKKAPGKKQYGYLKASSKAIVNEIVDELAKDPRIASAYDLWYELREEILRTYKNNLPARLSLSQQKEFKRIKNLVIEEAVRLGEYTEVFAPESTEPSAQDSIPEIIQLIEQAEGGDPRTMYLLGKLHLEKGSPSVALRWFQQAAEQGNQFAQYTLGKLYLLGKDVPQDREAAVRWFTLAAEQGNRSARFFLDHMNDAPSLFASATRLLHHMSRVFQEQAPPPSGGVSFVDSKLRRRIKEKKIAMGHKPNDHEEPEIAPRQI